MAAAQTTRIATLNITRPGIRCKPQAAANSLTVHIPGSSLSRQTRGRHGERTPSAHQFGVGRRDTDYRDRPVAGSADGRLPATE
jgi:hypothetical protein